MNIVSIMAHQDDEMRCLGTMLKCQQRGDKLAFATLTDGSRGLVQNPRLERAAAAQIRHQEMSALAAALKARYINLGELDSALFDTAEVRVKLIEAIRATQAEVIFTHVELDYNLDHGITNSLVRHCAMVASLPVMPSQSPPLAKSPAIFLVPPHGAFAFAATHFVDIGPFEAQKVRLLKLHASQETAMRMALGSGFEELCRRPDAYWGEQAGCEYAEAFTPMHGRGTIKPYSVLP